MPTAPPPSGGICVAYVGQWTGLVWRRRGQDEGAYSVCVHSHSLPSTRWSQVMVANTLSCERMQIVHLLWSLFYSSMLLQYTDTRYNSSLALRVLSNIIVIHSSRRNWGEIVFLSLLSNTNIVFLNWSAYTSIAILFSWFWSVQWVF